MAHMKITTQSGSIYHLHQFDDKLFLQGENVVTRQSKDLRAGMWEVEAVHSPEVGKQLHLVAPSDLLMSDPKRIPGGGKITSLVTRIDIVL